MEAITTTLILLVLLTLIGSTILYSIKKLRILVPSDQAAIIYGRKSKFINPETGEILLENSRIVSKGAGAIKIPVLEDVIWIGLQNFEVKVEGRSVLSSDGVRLNVSATALLKIADDEASIRRAAIQFGDTLKKPENMARLKGAMEETLQGHFRAIISTLTAKELYFEREKFIQQVQKASGVPLETMGIEVVSFTMNNINDEDNYFEKIKRSTLAITDREQEELVRREKLLEYAAREDRKRKKAQARQSIENQNTEAEKDIKIKQIQAEEKVAVAQQHLLSMTSVAEKEKTEKLILQEEEELRFKQVKNEIDFLDADLEARKNIRLAESEGISRKLNLEGEAAGKQRLAEVYQSNDDLTRLLLIIEELPELIEKVLGKDGLSSIFREIAEPMKNIQDVRIYDFSGSNSINGEGSPITKIAEASPMLVKKILAMLKDLQIDKDFRSLIADNKKEADQTDHIPLTDKES